MEQSFWVFLYLGRLSCFFLHTWLVLGPFPGCKHNFFSKMDPTAEAYGYMSTLIMGRGPSLFDPQVTFSACADRKVFLDLRSGHFISLLQQSSASATSFDLGVSGWGQRFSFTPLGKYRVSSPEAHSLLPRYAAPDFPGNWAKWRQKTGPKLQVSYWQW